MLSTPENFIILICVHKFRYLSCTVYAYNELTVDNNHLGSLFWELLVFLGDIPFH